MNTDILVEFERHVKSRHVPDNKHHHYCDQHINVNDVKTQDVERQRRQLMTLNVISQASQLNVSSSFINYQNKTLVIVFVLSYFILCKYCCHSLSHNLVVVVKRYARSFIPQLNIKIRLISTTETKHLDISAASS